jgi:hypothetical protein
MVSRADVEAIAARNKQAAYTTTAGETTQNEGGGLSHPRPGAAGIGDHLSLETIVAITNATIFV